ncbi:MAG: hypothetical protein NWE89_16240 [Candidatus Bathyarchaeota archaeon]|nr:hypothetical protein [Candidatus Bathyarchaeota archaeon]
MKTLIVYFTRTGNTKKIVDILQKELEGDVETVTEESSRQGILGWLKSGGQGGSKADIPINPLKAAPSDYELVVMASPVWAGNMSAPMRAFIKKYKETLPKTAVFLTRDSPDVSEAFTDIDELLSKKPLAHGEANRRVIQADEHHEAVKQFLEKLTHE